MEVLVRDYVSISLLWRNLTNFKGTVMVFEYNNSIMCLNYDTDPPPTVRDDLKWKVTSDDILYMVLFIVWWYTQCMKHEFLCRMRAFG